MVVCTRDVRAHEKQKIRSGQPSERVSVPGRSSPGALGPVPKVMEGKAVPYYLGEAGLELGAEKTTSSHEEWDPEAL